MTLSARMIIGVAICGMIVTATFYVCLTADPIEASRLSALGQLLSACGLIAAVTTLVLQHKQIEAGIAALSLQRVQLDSEYEWRRRQYTLELGRSWNQHTRKHLDALSSEFPAFFRVPKYEDKNWFLPLARAKELVLCEGESPTSSRDASEIQRDRDLRNHLISVLNYFELLAQAYEQKVVDEKAIEDSYSSMMIDTCDYFTHFLDEMRQVTRRHPWPPLDRVIALWRSDKLRKDYEEKAAEQRAIAQSGPRPKGPVYKPLGN